MQTSIQEVKVCPKCGDEECICEHLPKESD